MLTFNVVVQQKRRKHPIIRTLKMRRKGISSNAIDFFIHKNNFASE